MKKIIKNSFRDCIDTVQMINHAAREGLGEDSFFCAQTDNSAVVCVFDGCGGLGARKYDTFQGHTGAYMASRTVAGAICDWYNDSLDIKWGQARKNLDGLKKYIMQGYEVVSQYAVERLKISGTMVRKFPTTLALAYIEKSENRIMAHIVWAGDSRVYLLDHNGLAQLTKDDTEVEDAMENLTSDAPMTNVLSADGQFHLNYKSVQLSHPAFIFAATDGCFGYIPSPMEFEGTILQEFVRSKTPRQFRNQLYEQLVDCAGDDIALGLISVNFGTFSNTQDILRERYSFLKSQYLLKLNDEENEKIRKDMWNIYKKEYERYL